MPAWAPYQIDLFHRSGTQMPARSHGTSYSHSLLTRRSPCAHTALVQLPRFTAGIPKPAGKPAPCHTHPPIPTLQHALAPRSWSTASLFGRRSPPSSRQPSALGDRTASLGALRDWSQQRRRPLSAAQPPYHRLPESASIAASRMGIAPKVAQQPLP